MPTKKDVKAPSLLPAQVGFTSTGLALPKDLTFDDWQAVGVSLLNVERGINWAIGDWLNYGQSRYGAKYTAAVEATGRDVQTLMNVAWVASRFTISRRRETLSWSHHAEVAGMEPRQADAILKEAEQLGWSRSELRGAMRALRSGEESGTGHEIDVPELNKRIAKTVSHILDVTGLSQRAFAEEIYGSSAHQGTISRIVNAKQRPNLASIERMCEVADVPISIFGLHDSPMLPAGPVQRAAQEAIDALGKGETRQAVKILERLSVALGEEDLAG